MNNYDYILKLLNFQDKNIEIIKIDFVDNTYYIYVNQQKDLNISCPKCGGMSVTKSTTYIRTIKHTPINGYPCLIKLSQIRYKSKYIFSDKRMLYFHTNKKSNFKRIKTETIF